MEKENYSKGIIFKWINKDEILNKYQNKGRSKSLQKHIDKLHADYIATRPGTSMENNLHGMFGYFIENNSISDVEELDLKDIKKYIGEICDQNIDVFKTVVSFNEDDCLKYKLLTRKDFKSIVEENIKSIAEAANIPYSSFEWCASYHSKNPNQHVHILFWDKEQFKNRLKKPFINYKEIRKAFAKSLYKEELQGLYDVKNVSKKEISTFSKKELSAYKQMLKEKYQNKDLEINFVDTDIEEKFLEEKINHLEVGQSLFIYNKSDPSEFSEITKTNYKYNEKFYKNVIEKDNIKTEFKNYGMKAILYKDNSFSDTVCFLSNFENIDICYSKDEMEKIIHEHNKLEIDLEIILKEIIPEELPEKILSNKFREKSLEVISNQIMNLENIIRTENKNALGSNKITYRYDVQQEKVKRYIDDISKLILNTSKDCRNAFNSYINSEMKINKILGEITNKKQFDEVKKKAKSFMYNKIGNQILKFLKEIKSEEYQRKQQEYLDRKMNYELQKHEKELNSKDYELKKEKYLMEKQEANVKNFINNIASILENERISSMATLGRYRKNLSKQAKKELFLKNRNKRNRLGS